jgi:diguanylate cyclase (GGDEF)-like protein
MGVVRCGLGLVALNLVLLAFLAFIPSPAMRESISNLGGIIIPLVAAACCLKLNRSATASRLSGIKYVPAILAGSAVCYALGTVSYSVETMVLHLRGNPGFCDLFYLLQYGFFIWALCLWPSKPLPGAMRWRSWSDALVLLITVMAFGWVWLVGPAIKDADASSLAILIDAAYPTADILIIFSMLQMMRRGLDPRFRIATYLLLVALTFNTLGDIYYAITQMDGIYVAGNWMDATWPITASAAVLAGLVARVRMTSPGFIEARNNQSILLSQRTWSLYTPYVLVPAVGLLVVQVARNENSPLVRNGLYYIGVALVVAILIRQLIAITENGALYKELREAYDELELKNLQISRAVNDSETMNFKLRIMADELAGQNRSLTESNEMLEQMATRDGMTGLANHRALQERLRDDVALARRQGHPLVLALVDVDFFKQYNDHYGHPAGDEVLRSIAKLLQESIRQGDLAARYGGEEFALLLPYVDRHEATVILERLREAVSTFPFPHRRVTLSIGVCHLCEEFDLPEKLLDFADKALYAAKSRGRNQIAFASELGPPDGGTASQETFDLSSPMGYGQMISAGLQYNPQALAHEPQCALIAGLLATLELRDPLTRGNSLRVMWFALRLAQQAIEQRKLKFSLSVIRSLAFGALLHDIGRIGIKETVLSSIEPFTQEERHEIERHPAIGRDLINRFPALSCAIPYIENHHERWDGKGYPNKLKGDSIPIGARILTYADAYNAMSMDRPYAAKKSHAEICTEFNELAGKQFDPGLLDTFLAIGDQEWEWLRNGIKTDFTYKSAA